MNIYCYFFSYRSMRILIIFLLSLLIINFMVPKNLQAKDMDYPLKISAGIKLKANETEVTSKVLLNTSFPATGWDFRISLNQSEPVNPEIFLRYNQEDFFSQFGSMYINGLLQYLENPFFVNKYEDFF